LGTYDETSTTPRRTATSSISFQEAPPSIATVVYYDARRRGRLRDGRPAASAPSPGVPPHEPEPA
jgi:hypothetical protein